MGILGVWLVKKINPKVDDIIDRFKGKIPRFKQRTYVILTSIFLLIDCIVSIVALDYYKIRVIVENEIDVPNFEYFSERYDKVYSDEKKKKFIEACWGNEVMIKTFPNIKVNDKSGNIVYLNSYYPEIQNYYYKLFDNEVRNLTVDGI